MNLHFSIVHVFRNEEYVKDKNTVSSEKIKARKLYEKNCWKSKTDLIFFGKYLIT